jgi:hypothetical protein
MNALLSIWKFLNKPLFTEKRGKPSSTYDWRALQEKERERQRARDDYPRGTGRGPWNNFGATSNMWTPGFWEDPGKWKGPGSL